jgi:hypothetical protein
MAKTGHPDIDIKGFFTEQENSAWHKKVCTRIEYEFRNFYLLDQKPVSETEGDYDEVVDPSCMTYADKLTEELAFASRLFTIPLTGKEEAGNRENITMTERACYGLLNLADQQLTGVPYGCPAQAQMAFDVETTGFIIPRYYLYKDPEDGQVHSDLALWDFKDTGWKTDGRKITEIVHRRLDTAAAINDRYGTKLSDTSQSGLEIYDYFNEDWELVEVDGEIVHENKHGLGHVPVTVITSGSMRMPTDASRMAWAAPSCWARGAKLWLARSRILTYRMTYLKKEVKRPVISEYDSSKGGLPVELDSSPDKPATVIEVDTSKGQNLTPMELATLSSQADRLDAVIKQSLDNASAADIFYGVQGSGNVTAQGTQMLINLSRTSLKQGKRAVEQALTWLGNEMVLQMKAGKFKDMDVVGVDGKNNQFAVTVNWEKLVTNRKVEARLDIDTPQDKMANVGQAIELWRTPEPKVPDEYIYDSVLHVADPDAMKDKLLEQKMDKLFGSSLQKYQALLIKKDPEGNALIIAELHRFITDLRARLMDSIAPRPMLPSPEQPPVPTEPGTGGAGGNIGLPGATPLGGMGAAKVANAMPSNRLRQNIRTAARPPTGVPGG